MSQLLQEFFQDEQHAFKILVNVAVGSMIVGFVVAVAAILFLK